VRATASALGDVLAAGLSSLRGRPITVRAIERHRLEHASSFAVERLDVVIDDGEHLAVFFKDLHPGNQLVDARRVREMSLDRSRTELDVYKHLLSRWSFGTPRLYAYSWNPDQEEFWLFLECIEGKKVSKLANTQIWRAAARWAARLHVAARAVPHDDLAFLPRIDEQHYRDCARRLAQKLPDLEAQDRELVENALTAYTEAIPRLAALPMGLIHGEYYGKNILASGGDGHWTITAIDWETAAVGPSFLDITSLSTGDWSKEQKDGMRRAYFEQYCAEDGGHMQWDEFEAAIRDLSLYQTVRWVGWWPGRGLKQFDRWIKEMGRVVVETRL
jgi:aminoglycoside phosphotransferase (APT) family kinase protein